MPKVKSPRKGSLAFKPRKRASRIYPVIRSWPIAKEIKPLGFAGYKAGMTHVMAIDKRNNSPTAGQTIQLPVTVIDCPPLFVFGVRAYSHDYNGLKPTKDLFFKTLNKDLSRKIKPPKNYDFENKLKEFESCNPSDVKLIVHTLPNRSGLGKKKPEIFEVGIGGSDVKSKIEYAKQMLGKEISAKDIFKNGDWVDAVSVTTGKGFAGTIKRHGVKMLDHKEGKNRRGIGSMGQKRPGKLRWTVPLPGQLGFHSRTELNKRIILVGDKNTAVTPAGGFVKYGLVPNDYLIVQGSVAGPRKRLIRLRFSVRPPALNRPLPELKSISLESKQGV
ncbi:MAG: 50S ribosomal protein L3 [Candidatus Aenigmarchaeota archaeon]|nr:50S ribosomal protein L3 [Candidatus Aenigmarchaeota archaeon]